MKHKKKLLCIVLSLIVATSAIYAAYQKPKEVQAAVVIDDAMLVAALLAVSGVVLITGWANEEQRQAAKDKYGEDAIGEIERGFADYMDTVQHAQDLINKSTWHNLGLDGDDDGDDGDDDDGMTTWEKLKKWANSSAGDKVISIGAGLLGALLAVGNLIKSDGDKVDTVVPLDNVYRGCVNILPSNAVFTQAYNEALADGSLNGTAIYDTSYGTLYVLYNKRSTYSFKDYLTISGTSDNFTISQYTTADYNVGLQGRNIRETGTSFDDRISYTYNASITNSFNDLRCAYINPDREIRYADGTLLKDIPDADDYLTPDNTKYGSQMQTDSDGKIVALPFPTFNLQNFAQNYEQNNAELMDALLEKDDTKIQAAVDKIVESIGSSEQVSPEPGDGTESGDGTGTGTGTGTTTKPELGVIPDIETESDLDGNFFLLPEEITEKFPFCVPFDIIRAFRLFDSAERNAPHFEVPIKAERYGIDEKIVIDLSDFNSVAALLRNMELILFIIGLAYVSRDLIKG